MTLELSLFCIFISLFPVVQKENWAVKLIRISLLLWSRIVSLTKKFLHFQYLLRRASLTESDAFTFLKADNEDCITYSGFCEALRQVWCSRWLDEHFTVSNHMSSSLRNSHVKRFFHFVQLNLIGHCHGLSVEETKDLWLQADIDGNGVLDYKQFLVK